MKNERIDHADEATKLLGSVYSDDPAILDGLRAQVHATLALVEQQRIANLIAMAQGGHGGMVGFEQDAMAALLVPDERHLPTLRPEMAAALGIEEVQS